MFRIKFWGVRGSLPTAGPEYQDFGGASCCVSVQVDNKLIIFDAGSGIYPLGKWVLKEKVKDAHIFLSHLHFDHVIGLPFFAPIWQSGNSIHLYAGQLENATSLQGFLKQYISPPLFPVSLLETTQADLSITDLKPSTHLKIGNINIETVPLNHPGGALGFRLSYKGKSMCYITDTEHPLNSHDETVLEFIKNTDCLIYDATFTEEQYLNHLGWGHSTWEEAVYIAQKGGVKNLFIYHLNPENDDKKLLLIENLAQKQFPHAKIARQGMVLDLLHT